MEDLLNSLNNLTPVVAVGSLAIFMTHERWLPYFEHETGRGRQRWHNLGMVMIAFLINVTLGGVMLLPAICRREPSSGWSALAELVNKPSGSC